nr:MAG TPA: hypothetical protein [Caudoviricetes sp.]
MLSRCDELSFFFIEVDGCARSCLPTSFFYCINNTIVTKKIIHM